MFANLTTRSRGGRAANERDELASPHVDFLRLAVSACRPASVIFKRTTSTVRPPAIMRSTFAIARPDSRRKVAARLPQPFAFAALRIADKPPRRPGRTESPTASWPDLTRGLLPFLRGQAKRGCFGHTRQGVPFAYLASLCLLLPQVWKSHRRVYWFAGHSIPPVDIDCF
jgi:hypothetical protein